MEPGQRRGVIYFGDVVFSRRSLYRFHDFAGRCNFKRRGMENERENTRGTREMIGILRGGEGRIECVRQLFLMAFLALGCAAPRVGSTAQAAPSLPATRVKSPARPKAATPGALGPPTMPVEEIIQRFAATRSGVQNRARQFHLHANVYRFRRSIDSGRPDGEYTDDQRNCLHSQGKRYEKVTYAPTPTLERITLSQQDLDDLEHVQPFVLTTNGIAQVRHQVRRPRAARRTDHLCVRRGAENPRKKSALLSGAHLGGRQGLCKSSRPIGKAVPDIQERTARKTYFRDLRLSAKMWKAITGFRPTRDPMTCCISAAATYPFA